MKLTPPKAELDALFVYEPWSGILRWRKGIGRRRCGGNPAGTLRRKRTGGPIYLCVAIDEVTYQTHRIIWKMATGQEPPPNIDHINTDPKDNRWTNLRAATNGQNIANSRMRRDNTSGMKGLYWDGVRQKWRGRVTADKKQHYTPRFDSRNDALAALAIMRAELHGAFARSA